MRLLLATNNPGKVKEIKPHVNKALAREIISLADLGLFFEAAETGNTFEANAVQKAAETADFLKGHGFDDFIVVADDSGFCVEAMGDEPGVDSANFMGRETPYEVRNEYIINEVNKCDNRRAKFMCVIACVFPSGEVVIATGEVHGEVAQTLRGENGFGYDPIFFVPSLGKTMAELTMDEKSAISHRGQALKKLLDMLKERVK